MFLQRVMRILMFFFVIFDFGVINAEERKHLHAQVASSYIFDSNVFRSNSGISRDLIMEVSPQLGVNIYPKGYVLNTSYNGKFGRYINHPTEDYFDHNLTMKFFSGKETNFSVMSLGKYVRSKDDRGNTGVNILPSDFPNFWTRKTGIFKLKYKKADSKNSIEGGVQQDYLKYNNSAQFINNSNVTLFSVKNSYVLTGKTSAYLSASLNNSTFTYLNDVLLKNNNEIKLVVGTEYKVSGKTENFIEMGLANKNYDNKNSQDYNYIYVDASLLWKRKSYSEIELKFSRNSNDRVDSDSLSYVNNEISVAANHFLTHRWKVVFVFQSTLNQLDNDVSEYFTTISPGMRFVVNRWLALSANVAGTIKRSTVKKNEYNILTFNSSLILQLP